MYESAKSAGQGRNDRSRLDTSKRRHQMKNLNRKLTVAQLVTVIRALADLARALGPWASLAGAVLQLAA